MPSETDETSPTNERRFPSIRPGLARRVVAPVAVLAVIVVASNNVLGSTSLADLDRQLCQTALAKADEAPADIVLLGSSRTGAAIDPIAIENGFGGTLETADKIVLTLGSEFDRNLLYRMYAEHRGPPRVLAIESSFERRPDRIAEQGTVLGPTGRTMTLFGSNLFGDLMGSLRAEGKVSLTDVYVRSELPSVPSYTFDRLGIGVDQALRNPAVAVSPIDECSWSDAPRPGRWVDGAAETYVEQAAKKPGKKKQARWIERLADSRAFDLSDPWTEQEMALLTDLVATAYDDGVETVILYYLPSFQEDPGVIDLDAIQARIPGLVIFDGRTTLDDSARPKLQFQYHDRNHVNRFAAHEISVAIAELAEGTIE